MNIVESYDLTVYILRKQRNGFVSIDDWNMIAPRAQIDTFNYYYSRTPKGQAMHDALAPFKAKYDFTPSLSPAGLITLPNDYVHVLAGNTIVSGAPKDIIFPEEDQMTYAKTSQLRPVSINYPLGEEINTGIIQLTPAQGQTGTIWYLRIPPTPIYVYTLSGRTIIPNTSISTDFWFADIYQNMVIAKCLTYFGVNLSDKDVMEFSMLKQQDQP